MSNRWCFEDIGQDLEDKTTDEALLNAALSPSGSIYDGYYFDSEHEPWDKGQPALAPGVTELKIKQRQQRAFLLLCLFRAETREEIGRRKMALRRFAPESEADHLPIRLELTIAQMKRERGR